MRISLSWKDDDYITDDIDDARAHWDDAVLRVEYERDDGFVVYVIVDIPATFDDVLAICHDADDEIGWMTYYASGSELHGVKANVAGVHAGVW